jgi:hypothetical protein
MMRRKDTLEQRHKEFFDFYHLGELICIITKMDSVLWLGIFKPPDLLTTQGHQDEEGTITRGQAQDNL